MIQIPKLQITDPVTAAQVNRMQDQNNKLQNPVLKNCLLLYGVPQKALAFTASTPMAVNHGLGRAPLGFFPTNLSAAAVIFKVAAQPNPTLQLILEANADVTADLWIF